MADTFMYCIALLHIIDQDNHFGFIHNTITKEALLFFHIQAVQDITILGDRLLLPPPRSRSDVICPSVQPHQRTVHTGSNTNGLMESGVQ